MTDPVSGDLSATGDGTKTYRVPGGLGQVAADPVDSAKAFVALSAGVFRIDLGPGPGGPSQTQIAANLPFAPRSIAVSPDGQTLYVGGFDPAGGQEAVAAVPAGADGSPDVWLQAPGVRSESP